MSLDLKSNVHQIKLKAVKPTISKIYEFEQFRLDAEHLMLYRSDEELSLTPKQVETLLALVEHKGEIVSKDALMARLWGDAAVEESNLVQNVYVLRKILGVTSDRKPMIETLRRRGYRFNGEVTQNTYPSSTEKDQIGSHTQGRLELLTTASGSHYLVADELIKDQTAAIPFIRRRSVAAGIGAVILVAIIVSGYLLIGRRVPTSQGKTKIAVLPLIPVEVQTRDTIYDLGIAEALILKLGADKALTIRQLNSVRAYTDVNQDPIRAGKEQNVDYILSSHYQVANGRIKVTSQLIDVASGKVEDTFRVENDTPDLFSAQDAIANEIGNRLLAKFGSETKAFRSKWGTDSEEAYRDYQQAMTLLSQQRPGSNQKAIEYLDRAVELDPNYAKGWAGKAYAHSVMWGAGRSGTGSYDKAMEAAKKAIAIDPNLSEAFASLCENKFAYEYNWEEAEKDCKRAIELDPNSALAHMIYSMLFTSRGRFDEASTEIQRSMDLEPTNLRYLRTFATGLYNARRYNEAIEVFKRLMDLNPDIRMTHLWYIRALELSGRESEAFEIQLKLLTVDKKDSETIERFKAAYASSGWKGVLRERIVTELQENSPNYYHVAEWYGLLGDKDKAFEYMEKASQTRGWLAMYLRIDPRFDTLRDDPRFDDLVRRVDEMKLPAFRNN